VGDHGEDVATTGLDPVLEGEADALAEGAEPHIGDVDEASDDRADGKDLQRDHHARTRVVGLVVASVLAEEGEHDHSSHVGGGEAGTDKAHNQRDVVGAIRVGAAEPTRADENLVLRPETSQREDANEGASGDHEGDERLRHELAQPTHLGLHVEAVMASVAEGAG